MPAIVRHQCIYATLSGNRYYAIGPWPLYSTLRSILFNLHSTQPQALIILPVLHHAPNPNFDTITSGSPLLDQSTYFYLRMKAMPIVPSTTHTTAVTIPVAVTIMATPAYVHLLIRDPGPTVGEKSITIHVTAHALLAR